MQETKSHDHEDRCTELILRAVTNETGERGGVSPSVLRRIHRGADAAPLAKISRGWLCEVYRTMSLSVSRRMLL